MLLKGSNDDLQIFKNSVTVFENLWCHKFWIVFKAKNIEMYEAATMKLYRIVPFHYFRAIGIKSSRDKSSFIAFSKDGQYCIFKRVE